MQTIKSLFYQLWDKNSRTDKQSCFSHKFRRYAVFSAFVFLFAPVLSACGFLPGNPVSDTGFYFDTVITVTLYDASRQDALDHCFTLAETYENYFDATDPDSDVAKINANPGVPVKVHGETLELLRRGIEYGTISDGKFDITIGKLSSLWNFSEHANSASGDNTPADADTSFTLPDETELARLTAGVDYTAVAIDESNGTVTLLSDDCAIDLGGIAKGYIADRMKEYLVSEGITSALINLGGNVLAVGAKPDGKPFAIGIQKPFAEDGEAILKLSIKDTSVVTSGTYQRYTQVNGRIYHHIIDTATGYPYDNGLSSVTVLTSSSTDGDALSTTLFALGLKDGLARANQMSGVEAIFITTDNEIFYTEGIDENICTRM